MKDILMIAHFAASLQPGDNNRFLYLARRLSALARVELVTSDFYHGGKCRRGPVDGGFPFRVTLLHEPGYRKNISLRRLFSHWVFGRSVVHYLKKRQPPDAIYCAVPSLNAAGAAARYAKRRGIPFFVDVQDLWPEAFEMVFPMKPLGRILFAPMAAAARRIYAGADGLAAVSDTYLRRALRENPGCKVAHAVFLGTDLAAFRSHVRTHPIPDKDPGQFWLAYCGTLGSSYDLPCVMRALAILQGRGYRNIVLQVMGDGPLRETFRNCADELGVDVRFRGRLPYGEMCALLAVCDGAVNPIRAGSAASVINKHADYAAAGLPVINSQESPEYRALVSGYQMGLNCTCGSPEDMADKLAVLLDHPEERGRMSENALRCGEERFDRAKTYGALIRMILEGV